jgi:hypothetical protein
MKAKRIFVSTGGTKGAFGGTAAAAITAANGLCSSSATSAGLTGSFLAWLSNSSQTSVTSLVASTGPYVLVDGTVVAENGAGMLSGTLVNPVHEDAFGNDVASTVWTNVTSAGAEFSSTGTTNCTDFTSNSGSRTAEVGDTTSKGTAWTQSAATACNSTLSVYCIEQ